VEDFVANVARARKGYLEEKNCGHSLWRGQGPKEDSNLGHLKEVRLEKTRMTSAFSIKKKTVRIASLIASVAATIAEDHGQCIKTLAADHGVSVYTIHRILDKDLGLEKKSAGWVLKLLS
jgi:hypothetical protein